MQEMDQESQPDDIRNNLQLVIASMSEHNGTQWYLNEERTLQAQLHYQIEVHFC